MTYKDFLPTPTEDQKAFILDHGKTEENGQLKYADDMTSYGWNIHRFGKLEAGAFVLNRHPGKITSDRKFEIYAGGYVESVSVPDKEGNVTAVITHAFTINPPIRQGDSFIEDFNWTTESKKNIKNKKPGSWANFWNQYGMNEISLEDFYALMENQHITPMDNNKISPVQTDLSSEDLSALQDNDASGFQITLSDNRLTRNIQTKKKRKVAKKLDFGRINKAKEKLGALGEEIVFDLLTQEANENNLKDPIHVSKEEGDGLGYDIRAWDQNGDEIHIEVKTSTGKYNDGFQMSSNEIEASIEHENYKIYFLYNLNVKTKKGNLAIYDGPIEDNSYKLIPDSYRIYLK